MKYIVLADIHLSLYSQDRIISESALPERLHHLNIILRDIAEQAISNQINCIIIAGDIFHTKSVIHSLAQSVLLDFIRDYNKTLTFFIIDGNHDLSSRSEVTISALKCLDSETNVNMIHKTKQIDNMLFVPWSSTMFNDIKNGNTPFLISHFGLNEATLSSGISIVADIGLKDVKQYQKCILGHYHTPQEVSNIIYVGSPIQLDWGEKHEEKRFLIFDNETGLIDSIPTTGYKKYYEFEITTENKTELIEQVKLLQEEGHSVSITKKTNIDTADIEKEFKIVNKVDIDITNRGISSTMTEQERLKRFLEVKEIPVEKCPIYEKEALEIIEACAN